MKSGCSRSSGFVEMFENVTILIPGSKVKEEPRDLVHVHTVLHAVIMQMFKPMLELGR